MARSSHATAGAAAVRDDVEDLDELTPDAAFAALKNNHMTLTRGGRRGREGRAAMDTLAAARRQRHRGAGGGFGDRFRALEVVAAAREILARCPDHLDAVRGANMAADAAREALMRGGDKKKVEKK